MGPQQFVNWRTVLLPGKIPEGDVNWANSDAVVHPERFLESVPELLTSQRIHPE